MNKRKSLPRLVKLGIMTAFTTFVWIGFEVYRTFTSQPPPVVPDEVIAPLDPSLDTTTLNSIQGRVFFEDSQINEIQLSTPSTPQPTGETSPTPTATASPTPTPTSGNLNESTQSGTTTGGV